jgi:hypothetical protein
MARIAFAHLILRFAFCTLPFDLLLEAASPSDNHVRPLLPTASASLSGSMSRTQLRARVDIAPLGD